MKRIVKANEVNIQLFEFGLDTTKEVHSYGQFSNMVKNGAFKWNDPLQREYVWDDKKRSNLIVSGIERIDIGELKAEIVRESGKKKRNIIDGKQRGLSLYHYKNNKWGLARGTYVRGVDENGEDVLIDISGLKFSELPEEMQERLNSLQIKIECYENLTPELKAELFYRWNSGESLKPAEKRKAKMTAELRQFIDDIKRSPVYLCGFSETALKRDANGDAVQQSMIILATNGNTSIDSKTLDKLAEEDGYTAEIKAEMNQVLQFLNKTAEILEEDTKKKVFTKNKLSSMVLAAKEAIKEEVSPEDFAQWLYLFFDHEYKERGFEQYASASTTSKDNVQKRILVMMDDFKKTLTVAV